MTWADTIRAWGLGLRALAEMNQADEVSMVFRDGTAITWDDELTIVSGGRTVTVPAEALDDERWAVAE